MTVVRLSSGGPWEDAVGYSRVVATAGHAWTAGCTAVVEGDVVGVGDAYVQAVTAFRTGVDALARAGFPVGTVVQTRMYVVDVRANGEAVGRAHREVFDAIRPAATMVGVAELIDPRLLVEVELVACHPAPGSTP